MGSLRWDQINAWRLSQHHLLQPAPGEKLLEVVTHVGGIHAQLMYAAEVALHVRVENLSPADVQHALWRDRTLIKTWAMRGTLHLLSARDFPLYVAARSVYPARRPPSYYTYHGVTPDELDAIREGITRTLHDTPMTRKELADAIAQHAGKPKLRDVLLSGWGALLKPSAFQGDVCFGPNQGQNVTFVRPGEWIGAWRPVDPHLALMEMARRFLTTYGPATTDDFARWWGIEASQAKYVFRSLGDEIETVDVEGWKAWALSSAVEQLHTLKAADSIRLLPQFDAYVVGVARDCEALVPAAYKNRVYRQQGWISAVVLLDGRMAGTWSHERRRGKVSIKVEMFAPPPASIKQAIQTQAQQLAAFLDTEVEVSYE
jgi:hypothetical protein